MTPDDALHAEREEAAAIRWDHEPAGRRHRGVWVSEDAPSISDLAGEEG